MCRSDNFQSESDTGGRRSIIFITYSTRTRTYTHTSTYTQARTYTDTRTDSQTHTETQTHTHSALQ